MMTESKEGQWIEVEAIGGDLWEPGVTITKRIQYQKLTPIAASNVLAHTGKPFPFKIGAVWWPEGGYGYRVYGRKVRKIYKRWKDGNE